MKPTTSHLLLEPQALASLLNAQPPEVQEAFRFPPATAMHEGGNPRLGKFDLPIRSAFKLDITAHLM